MSYRIPPWLVAKPVTSVNVAKLMLEMLESGEAEAVKWVRAAWKAVGKALTLPQVTHMLEHGTIPEAVIEAIRQSYDTFVVGQLAAANARAASGAASKIMVGMGATWRGSKDLLVAIERRADRLAVDMKKGTLDVIDYLARYYTEVRPSTAGVVANALRGFVGLTKREAEWVVNYQTSLIDAGAARGTINALTETMRENLLSARALRIARTETAFAVTESINAATRQAREDRLIRFDLVKTWDAANDAATCEECASVHGETVKFEEVFSVGGDPPLHPNCRCVHVVSQLVPDMEGVA